MCKSFHISFKLDPVYPIITLSHDPYFCSGSQNILSNKTIESIYTRMIHFFYTMSEVCIVLCQTMPRNNNNIIFNPIFKKKLIYTYSVKKITSYYFS